MKSHTTLCLPRFLIESANQAREQERTSEDYLLLDGEGGLLGVFDSVGGRDYGQLVSHLAGKMIAEAWRSLSLKEPLDAFLQARIRQADTMIASLVIPEGQRQPATTVVLSALSFHEGQAYATLAHVGDSRAYLLRAGQPLQRLTEDDGYFPFAVRLGRMTREEAWRVEQAVCADELSPCDQAHFARRNKITCAVGWTDFSRIQTCSLALVLGDRLVLCTDGVHDNLTDQEIQEVLQGSEECSAQRLVRAAYDRSQETHLRAKPDDISAIVVEYQ